MIKDKEFKRLFDTIACSHGFEPSFGGWFKESDECIVVLDLQKSNYGNYYEMNIKTYIQGVFGNRYYRNKHLVKKDTGDIFTRQPKEYNDVLDLDNSMDYNARRQKLESLFVNFVIPDTNSTLTKAGIIDQVKKGSFLLPAIKKELGL